MKTNPLQKKRLEGFLADQPETYWRFVEYLSEMLTKGPFRRSEDLQVGVESYNKMCFDFLKEQIQFNKCGKYRIANASVANESVYANVEVMRYYMKGLLLSYMFWPNHYKIFDFFRQGIQECSFKNYLEVGIGHGLFTAELLKQHPSVEPHIIDISETSIAAAKELLQMFGIDLAKLDFNHGNFLKVPIESEAFDFIVIGEVIEHVDDAPMFLQTTHRILRKNGVVFLTTCANCPAIDHVYHFHNVGEIRKLMEDSGFRIRSDRAWPAENLPEERWEQELITINYAGFLEKI